MVNNKLKVTSLHNTSRLCRSNTSVNASIVRKTLRTNNRALAKALGKEKLEHAETKRKLIEELQNKQTYMTKYKEMKRIAGIKDEAIEKEVKERIKKRNGDVETLLCKTKDDMLSVVQAVDEVRRLWEAKRRDSSLDASEEQEAQSTDVSPRNTIYCRPADVCIPVMEAITENTENRSLEDRPIVSQFAPHIAKPVSQEQLSGKGQASGDSTETVNPQEEVFFNRFISIAEDGSKATAKPGNSKKKTPAATGRSAEANWSSEDTTAACASETLTSSEAPQNSENRRHDFENIAELQRLSDRLSFIADQPAPWDESARDDQLSRRTTDIVRRRTSRRSSMLNAALIQDEDTTLIAQETSDSAEDKTFVVEKELQDQGVVTPKGKTRRAAFTVERDGERKRVSDAEESASSKDSANRTLESASREESTEKSGKCAKSKGAIKKREKGAKVKGALSKGEKNASSSVFRFGDPANTAGSKDKDEESKGSVDQVNENKKGTSTFVFEPPDLSDPSTMHTVCQTFDMEFTQSLGEILFADDCPGQATPSKVAAVVFREKLSSAAVANRDKDAAVANRDEDTAPVANRDENTAPVAKQDKNTSPVANRDNDATPVANRDDDAAPVVLETVVANQEDVAAAATEEDTAAAVADTRVKADSLEAGKKEKGFSKVFSSYHSKPGKIKFTVGRQDPQQIMAQRKAAKQKKAKNQKKMLPVNSPLGEKVGTKPKNVYDLSLNESIPVPSSITYGQYISTVSRQNTNSSESNNVTQTDHGILLVLGNGKRTKGRRKTDTAKKRVHYTEGSDQHVLLSPQDSTDSSQDDMENKAEKPKTSKLKLSAGHTPPRKSLDESKKRKLTETLIESNKKLLEEGEKTSSEESSGNSSKGRPSLNKVKKQGTGIPVLKKPSSKSRDQQSNQSSSSTDEQPVQLKENNIRKASQISTNTDRKRKGPKIVKVVRGAKRRKISEDQERKELTASRTETPTVQAAESSSSCNTQTEESSSEEREGATGTSQPATNSRQKETPSKPRSKAKESPITRMSKEKESPITRRSKAKESPITRRSKEKESPIRSRSKEKESPITHMSKSKESPITSRSKAKESPIASRSKTKESVTSEKPVSSKVDKKRSKSTAHSTVSEKVQSSNKQRAVKEDSKTEDVESQVKKKPRKESDKAPVLQEEEIPSEQEEASSPPKDEGRRARRKTAVSYKEPSLNVKLRRGDPVASSLYDGTSDAPEVFKNKKNVKKRSIKGVKNVRPALRTISNTTDSLHSDSSQ